MNHLLKYGVASDLAEKAIGSGLNVAMVRATPLDRLQDLHSLSLEEAKTLKAAVERQPIAAEVLHALLNNSLAKCNVCEGTSGPWFIVHHIEPYEKTQDNSYNNLIILCPNHHASAHGAEGLAHTLSSAQLRRRKKSWESEVAAGRRHRAAGSFEVSKLGIDYVNPKRIEECCIALLGRIPQTSRTEPLREQGILTSDGSLNEKFLRENLSGGNYVFDYLGGAEINHWRELVIALAAKSEFHDLNRAVRDEKYTLSRLESQFGFFTGEALGCDVPVPTNGFTFTLLGELKNVRFEWSLNADYLMSRTAIARMKRLEKYAIYGITRSISTDLDCGGSTVRCIPLLVTLPVGLVGYSSLPDVSTILESEPNTDEMEQINLVLQTCALNEAET